MFDSAIIAYGIILMKYRNQKFSTPTLLGFFLLAALSHGFFDFWLINEQTKSGGWVITVYYFFITISIFATILNNALNNSSFFSYKRVVNSSFVANRMLTYYAVVFLIQIVLLSFKENTFYAIRNFIGSLNTTGFITVVAVVRLSRFKLIKNRWQRIRVEMPFSMGGGAFGNQSSGSLFNIRIKGESYNEAFINTFYQEYFYLTAVSSRSTELEDDQLAYIEEKLFLKDDETFYLSKIFKNQNKDNFERRLLKPKTNGTTIMNKKYPIVGLLMIESDDELTNTNLSAGDFEFQVWAYIKPVENKPSL